MLSETTKHSASPITPVALFAYSRPHHLRETLSALKRNGIPLLYVFCDGPKNAMTDEILLVRKMVREIDWCETIIHESSTNLGLGVSIRQGVTHVLSKYDRVIVVEDDVVLLEGAYDFLVESLMRFADDERVGSVTAWSDPRLVPDGANAYRGFFAGRYCCWGWGTYRRAWKGMEQTAEELVRTCEEQGINPDAYGNDMRACLDADKTGRLWAARFAYLQILRSQLCFWPARSLVHNIGLDGSGTNCGAAAPKISNELSNKRAPKEAHSWPPSTTEFPKTRFLFRRFYDVKSCPLCKSHRTRNLRTYPCDLIIRDYAAIGVDASQEIGDASDFLLVQCQDCSLQFFDPMLSGSGKFYEQLQKHEWYYMPEKWEHRASISHLRGSRSILEVGSAKGDFLSFVSRQIPGVNSIGLELNSTAAAEGVALGRNIQVATMRDIRLSGIGRVDAVVSFQVLEHLTDPYSFFEEAAGLLNPNGKLVISVPNRRSVVLRGGDGILDCPPHHVTRWDLKSLRNAGRLVGLKLIEIGFEPVQRYHEERYWSALFNGESLLKRVCRKLIATRFVRSFLKNTKLALLFRGHTIIAVYSRDSQSLDS